MVHQKKMYTGQANEANKWALRLCFTLFTLFACKFPSRHLRHLLPPIIGNHWGPFLVHIRIFRQGRGRRWLRLLPVPIRRSQPLALWFSTWHIRCLWALSLRLYACSTSNLFFSSVSLVCARPWRACAPTPVCPVGSQRLTFLDTSRDDRRYTLLPWGRTWRPPFAKPKPHSFQLFSPCLFSLCLHLWEKNNILGSWPPFCFCCTWEQGAQQRALHDAEMSFSKCKTQNISFSELKFTQAFLQKPLTFAVCLPQINFPPGRHLFSLMTSRSTSRSRRSSSSSCLFLSSANLRNSSSSWGARGAGFKRAEIFETIFQNKLIIPEIHPRLPFGRGVLLLLFFFPPCVRSNFFFWKNLILFPPILNFTGNGIFLFLSRFSALPGVPLNHPPSQPAASTAHATIEVSIVTAQPVQKKEKYKKNCFLLFNKRLTTRLNKTQCF